MLTASMISLVIGGAAITLLVMSVIMALKSKVEKTR